MRPAIKVGVAALSAAALVALAGIPLYVRPAHDEPRPVDAVYVIGPPHDVRIDVARAMVDQGLTDTVVVSLTDLEQARIDVDKAIRLCEEPQDFEVHCSMPDPFTTLGEAAWWAELAEQNDWDSVAVVTFTPHLSRTRVVFERCVDSDVSYIDSGEEIPPLYWGYQYAYQSAAFVKLALTRGC